MSKGDQKRIQQKRDAAIRKVKDLAEREMLIDMLEEHRLDMLLLALNGGHVELND